MDSHGSGQESGSHTVFLYADPNIYSTATALSFGSVYVLHVSLAAQICTKMLPTTQNAQHVWFINCSWDDSGSNHLSYYN